MHSPLVSAAWHARMTQAEGDDGLCVAHGKPVRVLSTFDANEVRGMIEQAHEWSKQGLYVVGGLSYEAAPVFDAALPVCMPHNFPLLEFHAFEPNQVSVLGKSQLQQLPSASKFMPWLDQQTGQRYQETYKQVRQAIEAGEFYQINLTTRLKAANPRLDAWAVFQHLYASQSAPQSFFCAAACSTQSVCRPSCFFGGTAMNCKPHP